MIKKFYKCLLKKNYNFEYKIVVLNKIRPYIQFITYLLANLIMKFRCLSNIILILIFKTANYICNVGGSIENHSITKRMDLESCIGGYPHTHLLYIKNISQEKSISFYHHYT